MSTSRLLFVSACVVALVLVALESRHQALKPRPLRDDQETSLPTSTEDKSRLHSLWTSDSDTPWFDEASERLGIHFVPHTGPVGTFFMPEINGTGGALFDYDNDDDLDLLCIHMGKSPKATGPQWQQPLHRLMRQNADGTFTDQTEAVGLADLIPSENQLGSGCVVGDVNNDGFVDVYCTNFGPDQLLLNRRGESFEDVTVPSGLGCNLWGTAAAFLDYDRDGWLDLIVVNYAVDDIYQLTVACGFSDGNISYCGPHKFSPTVDRIYHNEGVDSSNGTPVFREVTSEAGLQNEKTFGLGIAVSDFDGDGWLDFFIANDMRENKMWINQRDGTFREEGVLRGVATNGVGLAQGCMGVAIGDIDHDLDLDLVVTNLVTEGTAMYLNNGEGMFSEASQPMGLQLLSRNHTGWGIALVDVNQDGTLDMMSVNGFVVPDGSMFPPHGEDTFQAVTVAPTNLDAFFAPYSDRNQGLLNSGNGHFVDITHSLGTFGTERTSTRGLLCGDIDADGDVDFVTTSLASATRVYLNQASEMGNWLQIDCYIPQLNRYAIGATVVVVAGETSWIAQDSGCTSFLSANSPTIHFGLGDIAQFDQVLVRWPNGILEEFSGGPTNRRLRLEHGSGSVATVESLQQ